MRERPNLMVGDLPYREAFLILNRGRTYGMGTVNPLQISEILSLVMMGGIADIRDKPKYLRLMQKLDGIYLSYQAENSAKSTT